MNRVLLVVLVACGSEDKPAPKPAPATPPMVPAPHPLTAQLVACTNAINAPSDPRDSFALTAGRNAGTGGSRPVRLPAGAVPRVTIETPSVAGDLDVGTVKSILRRHVAKFQYCFEKQLLVKPMLAGGVIETGFAVQSTGLVASPRADGIDPEVAKCAAKALESVAFPAPLDGNQVQVTAQVRIDYTPPVTTADLVTNRPRPERSIPREWTPFAAEGTATDDLAKPIVDAVTTLSRARLPAVEQCFDGATGAVRAVIGFDMWGRIKSLRAGGIGDSTIETCIETALGDFTVSEPKAPVEVACDFTRGGDAPLRVSPDAGYTVIELTSREVRNRSSVREIPPRGSARSVTMLGASSSVLVIADPDAPGHGLEYALWWAPAGTTLVAVKAAGGAPVFVGMGDSRAEREARTEKRVVELRTDNGMLRACIPGVQLDATAPLLDPRAMDRVLQAVVAACKQTPCDPTIVVGTSGEFIAKDLVATTSAARRAGFQAISIGGPACNL